MTTRNLIDTTPRWEITHDEFLELRAAGTSDVPPDLAWSDYCGIGGCPNIFMVNHEGKVWGTGVKHE
jgi:hypothetical protein